MRTIQLTLAYDGTRYAGWQVQPNRLSLQSVVEQALLDLTGEPVKVAASGRTDAGVHALAQIVTFNTRLQIPVEGYRWGLVTRLPDDIVVTAAAEMPFGFHARFDAVRKTYRYVLHISRTASPWLRHYVWWHRGRLDIAAMQAATQSLLGTQDFRAFETNWPNRSSSVRTIFSAEWTACSTWTPWATDLPEPTVPSIEPVLAHCADGFLIFEITADGFLYNMVRTIVGTLVHIGRGRWSADDMARIIAAGDRRQAGDTAPAQGLYLAHVQTEIDLERIARRRTVLEDIALLDDGE